MVASPASRAGSLSLGAVEDVAIGVTSAVTLPVVIGCARDDLGVGCSGLQWIAVDCVRGLM